jgi:hypothetical protein
MTLLLDFKFFWFLLLIISLLQIVRREGLELWKELLPSLVSLSSQGPIQVHFIFYVLAAIVLPFIFHIEVCIVWFSYFLVPTRLSWFR